MDKGSLKSTGRQKSIESTEGKQLNEIPESSNPANLLNMDSEVDL